MFVGSIVTRQNSFRKAWRHVNMEAVCFNSGNCTDQEELDAFTEVEESLRDVTNHNKRASFVELEIPGNHSS
jgi:hypothetical protein